MVDVKNSEHTVQVCSCFMANEKMLLNKRKISSVLDYNNNKKIVESTAVLICEILKLS